MALIYDDRQTITVFPQPYDSLNSPYKHLTDFSPEVRRYIETEKHKFKLQPRKVIFIGDVSVGKTTIVNRYCYNKYQSSCKATIGVDFEIESFNILGQNFVLEMWDTAGQERFRCIAQAYYRNAAVVIIVFDMSKPETLDAATDWLHNAMLVNDDQNPLIFLVGTKSDLVTKIEFIKMETATIRMAETLEAEYWFVSARTGFQIIQLFQRIAALAFNRAVQILIENKSNKRKNLKAISPNFNLRDESEGSSRDRRRCSC